MTDYNTIKGLFIKQKTTDPVASQALGGSWASGGTMNTARNAGNLGSVGLQTAALGFGGYTSGGLVGNTESYNGTSFTEENDLNQTTYYQAGFGLQTAAISAGGNVVTGVPPGESTKTESYDGTSWTEVNDLGSGRYNFAGIGVSGTAGIVVGGNNYPPNYKAFTESWNGTNWTEVGDLNTARRAVGGFGTSTSAIAATGATGSPSTATESWNGTSWTEITEVNTGRNWSVGSGTQTSGIIFGGDSPTLIANTEFWDGSSWTELADLSAGVSTHMGSGQSSYSALSFGGSTPSRTAASEEWTAPANFDAIVEGEIFYNTTANAIKANKLTFGTGTWATGGTLNSGRQYMGTAGVSDTSALVFSGNFPATGATESYNGSTWTEVNDMSTGRGYLGGGAGTQTAAIAVGGSSPTNPVTSGTTEIWDGTNWTTAPSLTRGAVAPQSTVYGSTTGITTSALYIGGGEGTGTDTLTLTEAYNGTSWSEVGDLTTAVAYGAGIGKSDTDALLVTGINWVPGTAVNSGTNMYYNGTSWTELANANTARGFPGGGTYGSSTSALIFGGRNQGPSALYTITESWNGTSWTEVADLGTARFTQGGSGTSASAIHSGGNPYLSITEEWTQPSSIAVKSITVS